MAKILATSALPYANGPIHIGHLVEYIQTDIWVRYWRQRGQDAIYICADDTHGTPIMMRARSEGLEPEKLIERMWHEHRRDFSNFQIQFDNYYTTHSEENRELCSEIFLSLQQQGHIVEREIEQAFCDTDQMFLPDRYIRGTCPKCGAEDQYGDSCEICSTSYNSQELLNPYCSQCGAAPTWRESTHLFFRLSDFTERLQTWLASGHVQDEVANKLQEWFREGLHDWDISRDAPYFGFEIPGHPSKYFYVWLDAPVGYMASTMDWCRRRGADFDAYWRGEENKVYHFIGKDIIYFHALFWPAMLMGAGFRTPTSVFVHGFLTVDGEKMSKSRGTFINAETYLRHLDPQYLRYYYATKLGAGVVDLDLSLDDFINRVNAELVNKIANIPSRVLAILHKHCRGTLSSLDEDGEKLFARMRGQCDPVAQFYEDRELGRVTRRLVEMAGQINDYLQEHQPWKLADADHARMATVCTGALNAFKVLAVLIQPILPELNRKVAAILGVPVLDWANLDEVLENRTVQPYEHLVRRVERSKVEAMINDSRAPSTDEQAIVAPVLSLDPLLDCDFRTLQLTNLAAVEGADRLTALTLEAGGERREVIAGLGRDAVHRNLVGKNLLALVNLEPKTFGGRESQGMILAAEIDGRPTPVVVPESQADAVLE
ncbi:MAG: methionyl-tRNA synthetase [Chthoniobacter sp.]|nr:methionyl-tRNA synthetase [Chthoniobacter sp.]